MEVLRTLGMTVRFRNLHDCEIECTRDLNEDIEVDLSNGPNIFPTLVVLGAFNPGKTTLFGARLTNLHKCPRISAMMEELQKLGVKVKLLYDDGVVDGLQIEGKHDHEGDLILNSHADHRLVMALAVGCTRMRRSSVITGSDLISHSYPSFYDHMTVLKVDLDAGVSA